MPERLTRREDEQNEGLHVVDTTTHEIRSDDVQALVTEVVDAEVESEAIVEAAPPAAENVEAATPTAENVEAATPAAENDSAGVAPSEGASSIVDEERGAQMEQFPSPFLVASNHFRSGLPDGLSCGRSWEWPLTREEKKERITMLDREVLISYKKELEELKSKIAKKARYEIDSSVDEDEEDPVPECSCESSPKTDSELGIHIAG